jgi:hypothetical protein
MDKLKTKRHWTSESTLNFTHRIASDFLAQVETKIEKGEVTRSELADRLDRTPGRVSQLFNAANMTLQSAVRLARAANMKVALVAYEDGDPKNDNGPVNCEIFNTCWRHLGSPSNFFELSSVIKPISEELGYGTVASTANAQPIPISPIRLTVKAINRPTVYLERESKYGGS